MAVSHTLTYTHIHMYPHSHHTNTHTPTLPTHTHTHTPCRHTAILPQPDDIPLRINSYVAPGDIKTI